jgi:hypothetical protein
MQQFKTTFQRLDMDDSDLHAKNIYTADSDTVLIPKE